MLSPLSRFPEANSPSAAQSEKALRHRNAFRTLGIESEGRRVAGEEMKSTPCDRVKVFALLRGVKSAAIRYRRRRRSEPEDQELTVSGYGRSTTLITPSSLSRNFLYISGASSRLAGWVTTKLGSMSPASIRASSGLV